MGTAAGTEPPLLRPYSFAMYWGGREISAYEAACMSSFVRHGYDLTVYGFDPIRNLPPQVRQEPAQAIVEQRFADAFLVKRAPSASHFSDLFRYRLFQRTPSIYVDADLYLLRPVDLALPPTVLAREDDTTLCGAIMRLDPQHPALPKLVAHTEASAGRDLVWGETGPRLLTKMLGVDFACAYGPELFFPIGYDDFWKVLLPEHRAECEERCRDSFSLHLWNNIVTKVGVWKDVLPPAGSYLEQRFVADGMAGLFQGTFPADAMRHVIDNYRMRISGTMQDVTRLARMIVPGVKRRAMQRLQSVKHRWLRQSGESAGRAERTGV